MADSESSQQQSVGGVADAGGARGSYSNSAITMFARRTNPFRSPEMNRYWPRKYRVRWPQGLSDHHGTPRLSRWTRKATPSCFARAPRLGVLPWRREQNRQRAHVCGSHGTAMDERHHGRQTGPDEHRRPASSTCSAAQRNTATPIPLTKQVHQYRSVRTG